MVGEMVFIMNNPLCRTIVDWQEFKATLVHVKSQVCLNSLYKTLNKEVHRHRTVKIEPLAMYIFLDSEEVCVKLENGLSMSINLAFVSLTRNFW